MRNKVSIIIPVYNSEKYLTRCIESVLRQTYSKFELIIIDDGSTDNSKDICQVYAKVDNRIIMLSQENGGASSARNKGLRYATGDYLLFIDSDDWIDANLLEDMIRKIEYYHAKVVVFGWQCEGKENGIVHQLVQADTILSGKEIIEKIIEDNNIYGGGYTWNKFWCMKEIREQGNCFEESLFAYEDKVFAISNYIHMSRVLLVPEVYYHYFIREESLSHYRTFQWNVAENVLVAQKRIMDILEDIPSLYEIAARKYYVAVADFLASSVKRRNRKYIYMSYNILSSHFAIVLKYYNWSIVQRIKYRLIMLYAKCYINIMKYC